MLYIGYPVDDTVPNAKMGGHRKLPTETCFWNEAPKNNVNLHSEKRLEGILQELSGIIADLQDVKKEAFLLIFFLTWNIINTG